MSREQCVRRGKRLLKDLRLIHGRKIESMILVDNVVLNFQEQMNNGIYVPSFYGDSNDEELKRLTKFLEAIAEVDDVRDYVKKFSGLIELRTAYVREKELIDKFLKGSIQKKS